MKTIKNRHFIVRYDESKEVLYGIYGSEANGEITTLMFVAELRIADDIGTDNIKGTIYDLRRVEAFSRDNLAAMQRESFRLDSKLNMSNIPAAFVVQSETQEQMAEMLIKMTPGKERKAVVFSTAEAHAYFAEWHARRNSARA